MSPGLGRPVHYRPATDIAWVDSDEVAGDAAEPVVWVCRASDPRPRELRDWAWLIWTCAIGGGTAEEITTAVGEAQPLPEDGSVDVAGFLAVLESEGLITATWQAV